jgi:hypothetical protein
MNIQFFISLCEANWCIKQKKRPPAREVSGKVTTAVGLILLLCGEVPQLRPDEHIPAK